MPKLIVANGASRGTEYIIQDSVTIGRADDSSIIIPDPRVGRQHTKISTTPQGMVLEDMGSRNGTFLNGKPIQRAILRQGDHIAVCDTTFVFHDDRPPPPARRPGPPSKDGGIQHTMLGAHDLGGSKLEVVHEAPGLQGVNVSIAADFGEMMEQSPAWADAKKATERLRLMVKVATAISTLHEPKELLREVMNQLFAIFPQADRGFIMLRASDGKYVEAEIRKRDQAPGEVVQIQHSQGVLDEVIKKRRAVLSSDAMTDERFSKSESIMNLQIRSMIAVPLMSRDEVLGLIHLDSMTGGRTFSEDDLGLLNTIAPQVAIAVKNSQLVSEVKQETERRSSLARYISADLVDKIIDMDIGTEGELKYGTVFFSDIIGFTAMSEKISAKEVMIKLNRYFHVMVDTIFKFGGTIGKFQGDAIMAFWGVLAPLEHGELQAVQAALNMQNALYRFNCELLKEGQDPIRMGIGLNSGDFVAGNLGSEQKIEYTVIGRNVNLAQRIEAQAGRYQVFISESTLQKIRPYVTAIKFPPQALKNVEDLVPIYCVRGIVPELEASLTSGMTLDLTAVISPPDSEIELDVHIIWGRDCDDGSLLLDVISYSELPPANALLELKLRLQEKPSLPLANGRVAQVFPAEGDELPRARVMIPEPPVQLMELVMPGSVLLSDVQLDEMVRE